ncbi:class I SAM-dependent methyltransferase [Acuticoccus sp. MNP-M23]|uniref:class I SAM-dependent methyltransferase n=1 Tax=Acuticoccus sp. MNP-M23 TaxID=3072793 RepID=UPI0028156FE4|nr:class I SAM-dependent methyltransferase [Acuticoccus sp. MNP-M23]WMS44751.1 class I SAM-dependent methyltransferase [Acuticoccus sp. MNP-M23]
MFSRAQRRTVSFGLQTVLGLRQKGFFIPMRGAASAAGWADRPFTALAAKFRAAEPAFLAHLDAIDGFADDLAAIKGPPPEPRFNQTWFPRLDAAALYTAVRTLAPRRIIEVGSGHSTRFLLRAVRDGGLETEITAIDPQPRADIGDLPLTLHRATLQDTGLEPFAALDAGDLLFVDSSHVLMPGTDVDIILNQVIPALPAGVIVGFHDIFLPSPYPAAWPFTAYNEQNAVAPLLTGAALVFASAYVVNAMAGAFGASWAGRQPIEAGARESLLLLRL